MLHLFLVMSNDARARLFIVGALMEHEEPRNWFLVGTPRYGFTLARSSGVLPSSLLLLSY